MWRRLLRWLAVTLTAGAVILGIAGRLDLPALWAYIALLAMFGLGATLTVHPTLWRERFRPASESADRWALVAIRATGFAQLVVGLLDIGRFHWSDTVPTALQVVGFIVFAAALALLVAAMSVNRFFSCAVRVQRERGHYVVSVGPYRYVRHPGYLGMIAAIPSGSLLIGSWLSFALAIAYAVLIARRAVQEERYLADRLQGYRAYAEKVPYRLIPGVW